ncbi:unannotated protein [freshwater metagenome]|uniref:Unannotated protein n=1 Tax=freshwater metagenome TaxID=449393 RepID=A0A6J7E4G5_9ZZZZ|nr:hypothetical protein [Actinomycetota bacterium]
MNISLTKNRPLAQSRIMMAGTILILSAVAMLRFAPAAHADPIVACSTLLAATTSGSCTVAPGETIQITLKGGNGGVGGAGGTGGAGGAGLTAGSSFVPGGLGGNGGSGGLAGQGAKITGAYTNTQTVDVTLTYTVGSNGLPGAPGINGANGIASVVASSNGKSGQNGDFGNQGTPGTNSLVTDGSSFTLTAGGGTAGTGGTGGTGGQGGQGDGTAGVFGIPGFNGVSGLSGEASSTSPLPSGFSFSTSTSGESPAITFAAPSSVTTSTVPLATTGSAPSYFVGVALVLLALGASMMIAYRRFEQ